MAQIYYKYHLLWLTASIFSHVNKKLVKNLLVSSNVPTPKRENVKCVYFQMTN